MPSRWMPFSRRRRGWLHPLPMSLHVLTLPFVVPQVDVVEFEEMKVRQKSDLKEFKAELKRELKEELKTLETSFDGKVAEHVPCSLHVTAHKPICPRCR